MRTDIVTQRYDDAIRYARQEDPRALEAYMEVLVEGKKLPGLTELIKFDTFSKHVNKHFADVAEFSGNSPIAIIKALRTLSPVPRALDELLKLNLHSAEILKNYDDEYLKLYPRTGKVRHAIVRMKRVVLDSVVKNPRMSSLKKWIMF